MPGVGDTSSDGGTLRLLDYYWHMGHSGRILAVPADWSFFLFGDRAPWDWKQRDMPPTLKRMVSRYEPGGYDAAFLHLDQWCTEGYHNLRAFPYRFLDQVIQDVPKIVVNHGLPEGETNRRQTWRLIGANFLVTHSELAREMWGLPESQSRAIRPGYNADDWGPRTFERNEIVCCVSGSNTPRDHHGVGLIQRLKRDLPITWIGIDIRFDSFQAYRDYLAGASVFLNPTQWSQCPGARNEAMLSGLPVVTTDYLDETEYFVDGETGFMTHDYLVIRDTLKRLLADRELARRVGQKGREAARVLFDQRRYVEDWGRLLADLTGKAL